MKQNKRFDYEELREVLRLHKLWLDNERGGRRADLTYANLSNADLNRSYLSGAELDSADLSDANLSYTDLSDADLSNASLNDANLRDANLSKADLTEASLTRANLSNANLNKTDLSRANLSHADLRGANIQGANFSGCTGLLSPADYLQREFETDDLGVIVYKATGKTCYSIPKTWKIEPGNVISEVCDPNRTVVCGCGVNCATLGWCMNEYGDELTEGRVTIWECRIRWIDLAGVVVPYNTNGKIRCERLELIEKVSIREIPNNETDKQ